MSAQPLSARSPSASPRPALRILTGTEAALEAVQKAAGVPPAQKTGPRNANYSNAHANFVVAYTKDNLAHIIYPGGVSKDDWIHDLPLLIKETWSRP